MAVVLNGTTLIDNGALDSAVPSGNLILLSTQTASSSATISFTSGIDSTYKEYVFKFINIHPQGDVEDLQFNLSIDGGSNYNVTKTSTAFKTWHWEDDSETSLTYDTARDLAQSTAFQVIGNALGTDADQGTSGTLHLFNPASTVFVKHWFSRLQMHHSNNGAYDYFTSGYGNTTSAINSVQFKMANLNIDEGIIKMYGVL
jgi:hypothetical protein